jgi:aspartyl-tRNA(Asn)/glutamyl-tRNA(Gln) amidotransferase subunit A
MTSATPPSAALAWLSAGELARAYRARELSPVEVTLVTLDRIERLNPSLNAFLQIDREGALRAAMEAERSLAAGNGGPLMGIPVSNKDLLDVAGLESTGGSLVYKGHVATGDSIVTERLKRAGAVILGKTNTPEFGLIATTENRLGGPCRNPWDRERSSGGSSGGAAAAAAAGLGPLHIGTDGGGSIRIPAACCGVYGIKPTYGRVARSGLSGMPLFSHTGPLTRTVADAALMLDAIAGPDPRDVTSLDEPPPAFSAALDAPLPPLRAAWWPAPWGREADPELLGLVERAARSLEELGVSVEEAAPKTEDWLPIFRPLMLVDEYAVARDLVENHADKLTAYARVMLQAGAKVPAWQYSEALRARDRFRWAMADFFTRYDLLLTPVTASVPPRLDRPPEGAPPGILWPSTPYTAAMNITGQPAASLPCGFTGGALPAALQVTGRFGDDVTVLRVSAAYERAHPWAERHPPLPEVGA